MKVESVEEFLARGGEITKLKNFEPKNKPVEMRVKGGKPMHLGTAEIFSPQGIKEFEAEQKLKAKEAKENDFNVYDVPEELRSKLGI